MTDEPTTAALGPGDGPNLKYPPVRGAYHPPRISHRDFYVLSLHLAGYKAQEIAERCGYRSTLSIYQILHKKEVIAVRQQLLAGLDDEFQALYQEVVDTVREKLRSTDERVQLQAVDIWMKAHSRYASKPVGSELTAEDVVQRFLNQQINIQVNVGNKEDAD